MSHARTAMREADLLAAVIDLAHLYLWRVAHFRPCRTEGGWRTAVQADGEGFPDLILVRAGRLVLAELKRTGGQPTYEQWAWLALAQGYDPETDWITLSASLRRGTSGYIRAVEAHLWRPSDWPEIVQVLA